MKQMTCLVLLLSLLLSGCGILGEPVQEPVTFYYLRESYPYGSTESVIGFEERDASGHREDLTYLMALYLMGPAKEDLRSPLPLGTNIFSAKYESGTVLLALSDTTLTDVDFSLACACLAMTCMDLTGAEAVTITSGSRTVSMDKTNLVLFDSGSAASTEETQ